MQPNPLLRRTARPTQRGFTLIELGAVVVIVGVLAVLGTVGYQRYRNQAKFAEAVDLIAAMRIAQEAHKTEVGYYADISKACGEGSFYPAPRPGNFKTAWGAPSDVAFNKGMSFETIGVRASQPVQFGYAMVASKPGCDPACRGVSITHEGNKVAWGPRGMTEAWYIVHAYADFDGAKKGEPAYHAYSSSFSGDIVVGATEKE